jgi:putative two-component system response regulator
VPKSARDSLTGEIVLVVDDEPAIRSLLSLELGSQGYVCIEAPDAPTALSIIETALQPSVILSDLDLPGMSGFEFIQALRRSSSTAEIIVVTGLHDHQLVRRAILEGAFDYVLKPFEREDLFDTVRRATEKARLIRQNRAYQTHLERMVQEKTKELRAVRDAAILTLAQLAERRDKTTAAHLERISAYCMRLGSEIQSNAEFPEVSADWLELLGRSSQLHDIGKVGIPDSVLNKPGPLEPEERRVMRTHTTLGGDALRHVRERLPTDSFLGMAMEIAYSHHERWDGQGYPVGLAGRTIPLAARIVALSDAYDALTSRRPYSGPHEHAKAVERIVADRGKHFDPLLVDAFLRCAPDFSRIQATHRDLD